MTSVIKIRAVIIKCTCDVSRFLLEFQVSLRSFEHMHFSVQSLFPPQVLQIPGPVISVSLSLLFFFPFSLPPIRLTHTHCEEANLCSSEIYGYIVRNVCPS